MVKKQNNNAWIVYVIALIAIVALILGAVAVYKANMTGQGIFNWGNREALPGPQIPSEQLYLANYDLSNQNSATFIRSQNGVNVYVEIPCYEGTVPVSSGFNLNLRTIISDNEQLPFLQYNYHNYDTQYIGFYDPSEIILSNNASGFSWGYVYCATPEGV